MIVRRTSLSLRRPNFVRWGLEGRRCETSSSGRGWNCLQALGRRQPDGPWSFPVNPLSSWLRIFSSGWGSRRVAAFGGSRRGRWRRAETRVFGRGIGRGGSLGWTPTAETGDAGAEGGDEGAHEEMAEALVLLRGGHGDAEAGVGAAVVFEVVGAVEARPDGAELGVRGVCVGDKTEIVRAAPLLDEGLDPGIIQDGAGARLLVGRIPQGGVEHFQQEFLIRGFKSPDCPVHRCDLRITAVDIDVDGAGAGDGESERLRWRQRCGRRC